MSFTTIPIGQVFNGLKYDEHGLHCFTVARYQALGAFRPVDQALFYLYLYAYAHYSLVEMERLTSDRIDPFGEESIQRFVLAAKLGLEMPVFELDPHRLSAVICDALDAGQPLLLPINKRGLFYSPEYLKADALHLLLIKGYNPETNVVAVQDGEQNLQLMNQPSNLGPPIRSSYGDFCSEFYLPIDLLLSSHQLYNQAYTHMRGQYQLIRPTRLAPTIGSLAEALADLSAALEPHQGDVRGLLDWKLTMMHTRRNARRRMGMAYINSQQIFVKVLADALAEAGRTEHAEQIATRGKRACGAWKNLTTMLGVLQSRDVGSVQLPQKLWEEVLDAEHSFLKTLCQLGKRY